MSSVGMIFKADRQVCSLPTDWIPRRLGTLDFVQQVIDAAIQAFPCAASTLTINVENEADTAETRIISVSGVWGRTEMKVIRLICNALSACFYDAETAGFIEL